MSLTALDARTALLVVDLQEGTVGLPTVHPAHEIVDRAAELVAAFRSQGLPVVLINVAGGAPGRNELPPSSRALAPNWTELVPQMKAEAGDHVVTKTTWDAFPGTDLYSYLQSRKVTQVVLAGIATSIGVESTARSAYALGYNVALATDAMTDLNAEAHHNAVERIFPMLGETGTTEEIIKLVRGSR
ncbi:cysteine hydrolase [Streptomyces spinoverrucosus]|uniref:isochorismatase family cysteine hydrolase n=1 Tax=Streptomyces spinoverrucosus TaxID=284043 RepID=UPI0018C42581|nr:isochorismatase family cysteine hydrolase [Streptomyces spinoverrucosus]MBG0850369.1 cysteine hydrolase [Streptomyces spinoverrucosus]